jgi:hypothetical protein
MSTYSGGHNIATDYNNEIPFIISLNNLNRTLFCIRKQRMERAVASLPTPRRRRNSMLVRTLARTIALGACFLAASTALAQKGGAGYYAGTFSFMNIASGAQPQGGILIVGWDNERCGFADSILEQNSTVSYLVTQSNGGHIHHTTTFAQGWGLGPSHPSYRDTIEIGVEDDFVDLNVDTTLLRAEHGPNIGLLAKTHGGQQQDIDFTTSVPPPQPPTAISWNHSVEFSTPGHDMFPMNFELFAVVDMVTIGTLTPAGGTPIVFPVNHLGATGRVLGDLETGEFTIDTFQFASDFDQAAMQLSIDEFGQISMTGQAFTEDDFLLGAGDSLSISTFTFCRLYVELSGCIPAPGSAGVLALAGAAFIRRRRPAA